MHQTSSAPARARVAPYPLASDTPQREITYTVEFRNGKSRVYGTGPPVFVLEVADEKQLLGLLRADVYSLAAGFIRGEFNVRGDLVAAIRRFRPAAGRGVRHGLFSLLARFGVWRLKRLPQSRKRAARNIRFHYDRSNDFYRQFLDARMVYSCAYFKDPSWSLDTAQLAKLDYICRKLDLRRGERFLDVGCGWGALVFHAAEQYGAQAAGCTLSQRQFEYATAKAAARGLREMVRIHEADYRDLEGEFDKIASVGMFEHVGSRRLRGYFDKLAALLSADGLLLNHGIVRPQAVGDGIENLLVKRHVFPGGELVHLCDVIREAENAGFEAVDVENLRLHYALTCRAWVERLQRNAAACLRLVDEKTYRVWLLYLAGSADNFEAGRTDVYQVLLAKRASPRHRRLSREYMYTGSR